MKKNYVLLSCLLFAFVLISATPFFPMTNVMEMTVGNDSNIGEINEGNLRLETTYSEEELIILHYYPSTSQFGNTQTQEMFTNLEASDGVSIFMNGRKKMNNYHPVMNFGQPVFGEMKSAKFNSSEMYIDYLSVTGNQVNFIIRDAEDSITHSNLLLSYMLVEKEANSVNRNIVRNIHNEVINIVSDGQVLEKGHTFSENINSNHKVVIVIRDSNYNILQASSTNIIKAPFRVINHNNLSLIGASTGYIDYEYFAVMNTAYDTDSIWNLNIQIINDDLPNGWNATFCDHTGCFAFGFANVEITGGGYHEFHATIHPTSLGYGNFSLRAEINDHVEYINHYYATEDVDIFVIQDNMNEDDNYLIEALTYQDGPSVSLFRAGYANFAPYTLPEQGILIWNVPSVSPYLNHELLTELSTMIENGRQLLVIGQYIAEVLNSNNIFTYSNTLTNQFLNTVLGADFVQASNANYSIYGQVSPFLDVSYNLTNDNSIDAHYSTNYINANNSTIAFKDGADNVKGVFNNVILGETAFYDFDLKSIVDSGHRWSLITVTMNHFGLFTSIDDEIMLPIQNEHIVMSIYPNPVKDFLNINVESSAKNNSVPEIEVYNIKGQRLFKSSMVHNNKGYESNLKLDSIKLSSGIYFVKVNHNNESLTRKFLILKD